MGPHRQPTTVAPLTDRLYGELTVQRQQRTVYQHDDRYQSSIHIRPPAGAGRGLDISMPVATSRWPVHARPISEREREKDRSHFDVYTQSFVRRKR